MASVRVLRTLAHRSDDMSGIFHLVFESQFQVQGAVRERKVYLAQGSGIPVADDNGGDVQYKCFDIRDLEYVGFCDDFGPMNAYSVIKFVQILQSYIKRYPTQDLVCCVEPGRRNLTNAAFLMGCYMILVLDELPEDVWEHSFSSLRESTFEPFRDATFSESDFDLSLLDCWKAFERGRSLGWIEKPGKNGIWGKIILEEYAHYEDPLNGDLHIVVPDKFVAFKGPRDLPGGREYRDANGTRDFSPLYYVEIFKELGVKAVVRLNEPQYEAESFADNDIEHYDLEFEDCTTPPDHIVAEFFRIVDTTDGLVAVHCKAGLGRTGTMIALDLMRRYRFRAREAIGWLRIMRPGSVIGDQQAYLCDVERAVGVSAAAGPAHGGRPSSPSAVAAAAASLPPRHSGGGNSAALAQQVAEGMDRRSATRIRHR